MKPAVASYVVDFLKPEMLHVYRQIAGQELVTPWVYTHKRENPAQFPFPKKRLIVLPKPRLRWWRRLVHKHLKPGPWQIYRWELRHFLLELTRTEAKALHIYFGHMAIHMLPLIKVFPHPVVVSFHGADAGVDMDKPTSLAMMREVFTHADVIQARSKSLAQDLAALGCPPEKLRVQRTGIPLDVWPYYPRHIPPDGAWRILQSCRLIAKKGLDHTLNAFAKVRMVYPKAKLIIAGEGPLLESLQNQAQQLQLGEAVEFTGFLQQHELGHQVYQAHLFVHPSRMGYDGNREGIPNSMLEAMATGLPVISTHHGGIPEAVTHQESGLLIPENNSEALAEAMLSLLGNPDLARQYAQKARHSIEQSFDRQTNIVTLQETYLELIEQFQNA